MQVPFVHNQSAHCENGAISNLLNHAGIKISEPMAFGIGSGLFFGYMPFIKVNGTSAITYRILPGQVFKRVNKTLGISYESEKFRNEQKAMDALDRQLDTGKPVGLITSVFYLPYLPEAYRFHFNAHNIVVYGKENNEYLVSDPVMENVSRIAPSDLIRARFAKGAMAPKGKMYYTTNIPQTINWESAAIKGINDTAKQMVTIPVPLFGVKGIKMLGRQMNEWPKKLGDRKAALYLGNVVRMQEEIGTGGAGFRYIFAAFLQESSKLLNNQDLAALSADFTQIGDTWREFAITASRICKARAGSEESYGLLAQMLNQCSEKEEQAFKQIRKLKL